MKYLTNIPFDQLKLGDTASLTRSLTEEDLLLFARVSGDTNPVHLDQTYAETTPFKERIAHGMWTTSLISCALATQLPGPGGIYLGQTVTFKRSVKVNDTVTVTLTVIDLDQRRKRAILSTQVTNQYGKIVVDGQAEVKPSETSINIEEYPLPAVQLSPSA